MSAISRAFGKHLAKRSGRGSVKEALKEEYEDALTAAVEKAREAGETSFRFQNKRLNTDDMTPAVIREKAKNNANFMIRQAEGKDVALRTTELKQDTKTSRLRSDRYDDEPGYKTQAIQAVDTKKGTTVSIKTPTDEKSTLRATERRQKLRSAGESMYEAGLNKAAMQRANEAAAGLGIAVGLRELRQNEEKAEEPKSKEDTTTRSTRTESASKDERVNKEDYPTYRKDTKSAESFREAFKKAKEEGKESFSFEGRTYNTEEKTEMAKGGMVKAKKKKAVSKPKAFSVGGYAKLYGKK